MKAFLGYTAALLAVPVIITAFIGMDFWTHKLVSATGITVSPWFTGGEVIRTIEHGSYRTLLRRPVFDGLIGERKQGFVQIDWGQLDALPAGIEEEIDYDGDGCRDFRIKLNSKTGEAALTRYSPQGISLEGSYKLKEAWAVRVLLKR